MATGSDGYFKRSWALLTRDKGWIKPVLVLAATKLIPIVGSFGVNGYALEWARLTSWGVDSSPKQRNVDVGACIKTGAKAFVVGLGYYVAMFAVQAVLESVFGDTFGSLFSIVLSIAFAVLIYVAELRATIYQNIIAGYEIPRIFDMIKRDWKGLLRICGMYALFAVAVGIIATFVGMFVVLLSFGSIVDIMHVGYYDEAELTRMAFSAIAAAIPFLLVFLYFAYVVSVLMILMTCTAIGLWMRQFDVQRWGESSDPLPTPAPQNSPEDPYGTTYPTGESNASTQPNNEYVHQTWMPGYDAQPAAGNGEHVKTDPWADAAQGTDVPAVYEEPPAATSPTPGFSLDSMTPGEVGAVQTFSLDEDSGFPLTSSQEGQPHDGTAEETPVQTFRLFEAPYISEETPATTAPEVPASHDLQDVRVTSVSEDVSDESADQPCDAQEDDSDFADVPEVFVSEEPMDRPLVYMVNEEDLAGDVRLEDGSAEEGLDSEDSNGSVDTEE